MGDAERENNLIDEVRENFTLKTLQERVWRLEAENKELKFNNSILHTQYTSQCETQADILKTLHQTLEDNVTNIEELDLKNQALELQLSNQKQQAKDELDAQNAQWENRVTELQMKNEHLEAELHKVAEFRQNKAEMEAELALKSRQLKEQAEEHQRQISVFDRNKVIELDQARKDMKQQIKDTRDELKSRTKDQLDATTKRTIMDNDQKSTELLFQSKNTEQLLDKNKALSEENAQLRRNVLIHKELENELARRTHLYQKLLKKCQQRQKSDSVGIEKGGKTADVPNMNDSMGEGGLRGLAESAGAELTEENDRLKRQVEGIQNTLKMVRHEFAQYRCDHATLTQLQDHSTRLIIAALYELKNLRESDPFPPASYDENASWQFTTMTTRQKEYFFRVLLEKLNSSMCGTCFPTGPNPMQQVSATSLPSIVKGDGKDGGSVAHFSQYLWSVATHGPGQVGQHAAHGHGHGGPQKDVASKGCQTETQASDPCFKEGLWNPSSRIRHHDAPNVSPAIVSGDVRPWGSRAPGGATKSRSSMSSALGRAV
eukprot:TRINITY_DN35380_c0_g2_i1.p1 TRINITY_DN35380_c0_g2~~TRINITY_DN35380_c0_g2_i1.p1  ORF type:complete len:572 (-),score=96.06 TRINITY_DN35380_c0_g2_i1:166-1803(-)